MIRRALFFLGNQTQLINRLFVPKAFKVPVENNGLCRSSKSIVQEKHDRATGLKHPISRSQTSPGSEADVHVELLRRILGGNSGSLPAQTRGHIPGLGSVLGERWEGMQIRRSCRSLRKNGAHATRLRARPLYGISSRRVEQTSVYKAHALLENELCGAKMV